MVRVRRVSFDLESSEVFTLEPLDAEESINERKRSLWYNVEEREHLYKLEIEETKRLSLIIEENGTIASLSQQLEEFNLTWRGLEDILYGNSRQEKVLAFTHLVLDEYHRQCILTGATISESASMELGHFAQANSKKDRLFAQQLAKKDEQKQQQQEQEKRGERENIAYVKKTNQTGMLRWLRFNKIYAGRKSSSMTAHAA